MSVCHADRPEYDGAAYAVDCARRHATHGEREAVVHAVNEAFDAVGTAPYRLLTDRPYRQSTDAVAATKGESPDADRVEATLREMGSVVSEMHVLAVRGETVPHDEFHGVR